MKCNICKEKGEIRKVVDGQAYLITCPNCVKPNNKIGVVGKKEDGEKKG